MEVQQRKNVDKYRNINDGWHVRFEIIDTQEGPDARKVCIHRPLRRFRIYIYSDLFMLLFENNILSFSEFIWVKPEFMSSKTKFISFIE